MSEIRIVYGSLLSAMDYAKKSRGKIDEYVSYLKKEVKNPINALTGTDTYGYACSASNLASQKMNLLILKKEYFANFENAARTVLDTARSMDKKAVADIAETAEQNIEERKWYEKLGDWFYNTFCVDLANSSSLSRNFFDALKWIGDKVGNMYECIHEWFKYGDGKYIWNIFESSVKAIVAVAGAATALCGLSAAAVPLAIGLLGLGATSIGAVITIFDSLSTIYGSSKALSLSGKFFDDDDGNPGAARYYGSISKTSELFEKHDIGGQETNDQLKKLGKGLDTTKKITNTVEFACGIAALGYVKDFRVTSKKDNINYRYNKGKWNQGYDFSYKNIKRNILHDMGKKVVDGKYKKGSFGLKLISRDTLKKDYEGLALSAMTLNIFNVGKTVDNTMSLAKNIDKVYDFTTSSNKTWTSLSEEFVQGTTGIFKKSKFFSIYDKYGTKTGKTIEDLMKLIINPTEYDIPLEKCFFSTIGGDGERGSW